MIEVSGSPEGIRFQKTVPSYSPQQKPQISKNI